jgi:hypothetical protein
MKSLICIDPGASGGIAWQDRDGNVDSVNMPATFPEIADTLRELFLKLGKCSCVMEKVGGYMPGNSGPAAAKFARHCGQLEAILYCVGIPTTQVPPQTWMKRLGALPKDKKERKSKIKEMMQTRYPYLKVTLANADALGILTTEIQAQP